MTVRKMRAVSVSIGGLQSLIPSFSLVSAADEATMPCGGKICHPVTEYCSKASEVCQLCTTICDNTTHNYDVSLCARDCSGFLTFEPLKAEVLEIQKTQHLILLLVTVLLVLIALRCAYQCLRWLIGNRCFQKLLRRLQSKAYPHPATANGKDLNATTIQNLNAINRHGSDLERAQSHIYSVAGKCVAEGSVVTMTTPVSTRYPAENSTTPTTVMTEIGYGYDNQAMVVTPVTEKPSTATVAAAF
ncbi:protein grindelwald isoform X1 [Drosophila gunungcola]|uniref:protein grindelwald isoform X1 n=1 Tax=Drosophila gunungcola TaxID=103775 RepID=UPI0022E9069E|nr:protein grindelwald isoform X1 [Drosophila gunungcola]